MRGYIDGQSYEAATIACLNLRSFQAGLNGSQIHEQWPEAEHIARVLTHLYARVRFGQAPLTAEERSSAEMLLQTLHTLTRPAKAVHKAI